MLAKPKTEYFGHHYSPDEAFQDRVEVDAAALFTVSQLRDYAAHAYLHTPGLDETIVPAIDFFCTERKVGERTERNSLGLKRQLRPSDEITMEICVALSMYIQRKVPPLPVGERNSYEVSDLRHLALDVLTHKYALCKN